MLDSWWSEMNPLSGLPVTLSHTSHTHCWPTIMNRWQWRTTVCVCVCSVIQTCWRLCSINRALSLNLVLMWPMLLVCPCCPFPITHNLVEYFSYAYTLPLHLSPFFVPFPKQNTGSSSFSVSYCLPCKLNNKVLVRLLICIYPVRGA